MTKFYHVLLASLTLGLIVLLTEGCQPKAQMKVKVAGLSDKDAKTEKDNGDPNGDTIAPTVVSVTSSNADKKYSTVGEVIVIDVLFSEEVGVENGSDITLDLSLGTDGRHATYASGSGSATLIFNYAIEAEDYTKNLQYTATNALKLGAKGVIADLGLNDANLTLPALSAAGSLGSHKKIAIDTRSALPELFDSKIAFERKVYQTMSIKRLILSPDVQLDDAATSLTLSVNSKSFTCSITNPYSTEVIPAANNMAGLLFDDQVALGTLLAGIPYGTETEIKIKYTAGGDTKADSKDKITMQDFFIADYAITGFGDGTIEKDGFIGWVSPMHVAAAGLNASYDASNESLLISNYTDILLQ